MFALLLPLLRLPLLLLLLPSLLLSLPLLLLMLPLMLGALLSDTSTLTHCSMRATVSVTRALSAGSVGLAVVVVVVCAAYGDKDDGVCR